MSTFDIVLLIIGTTFAIAAIVVEIISYYISFKNISNNKDGKKHNENHKG